MPRKKKDPTAYRDGYIRPTKQGTFRAEIYVDGRQLRKTWKTRGEAEGWLDQLAEQVAHNAEPLSIVQLADARAALKLLPDGVSLTDAARTWVQSSQGPAIRETLVRDALEQIIAEKAALDRRGRTQESYRDHVGKFLRDSGAKDTLLVHEVTTEQIKAWLHRCGYRGKTWNGYRTSLHAFWAWAQREGMCGENPAAGIPKASVRREIPVCMPVVDVKTVLEAFACHDPELVPYYACGFFAGIRTAELDRMDSDCWQDGLIHIGPRQAKTGQQRYVTIQDVLAAWLDQFPPPESGRLRVVNHRRRYRSVLAKIRASRPDFEWPRNAMRHSFASYHLAFFRNSTLTAHELGHKSPALLYSTYRTLAKEENGREFFAIMPPKQAKNKAMKT